MTSREALASLGFSSFVTFAELIETNLHGVPGAPGAYLVVRESAAPVAFLAENPGGRFKGRDPTVGSEVLERKWVDGAAVVYIGKARDLRRRLNEYARFGGGAPVGHWGGRYIWQLADSAELLVSWTACSPGQTEAQLEAELVGLFKRLHGRLPFANIADPS